MDGSDTEVKIGVALAQAHWRTWTDLAVAADELGYESVWVSEHLVLPVDMAGSPMHDVDHPPVPPNLPILDVGGILSHIAALSTRIRLGTWVSLLAIRHPFIAARSLATVDTLSDGRLEIGVGAGWLRSEWDAVGLDPATRGRRLDESIEVCRRLWTEPTVAHHGEFWSFPEVAFEPKPPQQPPPVLVGGESPAAMRRAARLGDGWIALEADLERTAKLIAALRAEESRLRGSPIPLSITVGAFGPLSQRTLDAYRELGVDRLIIAPWTSSRSAIDALGSFAAHNPSLLSGPVAHEPQRLTEQP